MISLPRLFALVLIPLTLLLLLLACGSDEPTARPDSSRSDRSTSAPSSTLEGTTVSPTAVKGTSTYMLDLIPATTQEISLLDLKTIRENLNRFPGDFDVLKRELSERINDEFDIGAIEIEQVDELALPVAVEDSGYWLTVVLKGNFDFAGIRAAYEEENEERLSYGGYDGYTNWGGEIVVLLEDKGMIYKSSEDGVRALLDILNSGSGSLADAEAEDNELKRILDELGGSPAVMATVVKEDSDDDNCGNIVFSDDVAGCMGIGSAYSGSDDAKDEVYVDIVVLFSSERAAEQAADDSEVITSLMEEWLGNTPEEFAEFIGLDSAEPRGVSDVDTDDDLAKGTGTIGLGQPLPPPTPRPTRAPTATSAPAATTIPLPQATPAIEATPFRPQAATQAIEATPSRPQAATQAIEATPFRPQATPAPTATETPSPVKLLSVDSGQVHTCGVKTDGSVVCWGSDWYGQSTPPSGSFLQVSAGDSHTCGVKMDGSVVCWGGNDLGQSEPPPWSFTSVSAGLSFSCGVKTDRSVVCWGDRSEVAPRYTMDPPPSGSFSSVSAGNGVVCGIRTDGTAVCWDAGTSRAPGAPPSGLYSYISVTTSTACAVKTDGAVVCWGDNSSGEATPPEGSFKDVSMGGGFACGTRTNGSVACWGYDPWNVSSSVPEGSFSSVSAGYHHACGVRTDSSVACWGEPSGTFDVGQTSPPTQ